MNIFQKTTIVNNYESIIICPNCGSTTYLTYRGFNMTKMEHKESIHEGYRIRYIELTKAISGAFLGFIICGLAGRTSLDESSLGIVGTTIANFIGWLVGEQMIHRFCIYFNLYKESKSKNPLYRNFKTLASLGSSLGNTFAIERFSHLKLNTSIYSASTSFIIALSAFVIRRYRQSIPLTAKNKKNIYSQVGTEGWSKYAKLTLTLGISIGQFIGGYVSYKGNYDAISSWETITLYGSIAAIISFFSSIILIPLINYLTRDKTGTGKLVIEDKDVFNSNYVRTGMTLGLAIGIVLGGLLGPALFVGLSVSTGIVIGSSLFSLLCGIILGIYGHQISIYFQRNWGVPASTDNSWSYVTRNTSYIFSFIGTVLACLFCPGAALLQSATIGAAISSFIGWFSGLGLIYKARQLEPNEEKSTIPWTQRVSSGATKGSFIGAFIGLMAVLIFCTGGGSLGLIGFITLFSALGGIIGAVKEICGIPAAKRMIRNIILNDSSSIITAEFKSGFNPIVAPSSILSIDNIDIIPMQKKRESTSNTSFSYPFKGFQFFSSNTPENLAMDRTSVRIEKALITSP
jgi:hypothetical protein